MTPPRAPKPRKAARQVVTRRRPDIGVVLEAVRETREEVREMRGQMKVVIEALQDRPTRGELAEFRREVAEVHGELRADLGDQRRQLNLVTDAVRTLHQDVRRLVKRADANDTRADANDRRAEANEARADANEARMDTVIEELRGLRKDFANCAQASDLRLLEQRVTVLERHAGR
jgi:methyl-accepting chemotaxis protein